MFASYLNSKSYQVMLYNHAVMLCSWWSTLYKSCGLCTIKCILWLHAYSIMLISIILLLASISEIRKSVSTEMLCSVLRHCYYDWYYAVSWVFCAMLTLTPLLSLPEQHTVTVVLLLLTVALNRQSRHPGSDLDHDFSFTMCDFWLQR